VKRISIIGSEGCLGRALRRALDGKYDLRRADVNCPDGPGVLRADVRSQEDMERAVDGADVVVHLAAYHGGYRPPPTDETRFQVNVVGTWGVMQACLKKDVRHVVWASSIAARSHKGIYSMTKVLGENLCEYYHLTHGFQVAMMRYGSFTPCDLVTYGERLLGSGIDRRDCVEATVRAVDLLAAGKPLFGRYTVMPSHPWSDDELAEFGRSWKAILARAQPDAAKLVERYGIRIPRSVARHDISAAGTDLGFAPRYDFETFLAELAEKDASGEVGRECPRWSFETGVPPVEGVVWPNQERDPPAPPGG
jgi:nucleoside-diphosphate-sugar epimerase